MFANRFQAATGVSLLSLIPFSLCWDCGIRLYIGFLIPILSYNFTDFWLSYLFDIIQNENGFGILSSSILLQLFHKACYYPCSQFLYCSTKLVLYIRHAAFNYIFWSKHLHSSCLQIVEMNSHIYYATP